MNSIHPISLAARSDGDVTTFFHSFFLFEYSQSRADLITVRRFPEDKLRIDIVESALKVFIHESAQRSEHEEITGSFVITLSDASRFFAFFRAFESRVFASASTLPCVTFARNVFDLIERESEQNIPLILLTLSETPLYPATGLNYSIEFSTGVAEMQFSSIEQTKDVDIDMVVLSLMTPSMLVQAWESIILERKVLVTSSIDAVITPCCEFLRRLVLPLVIVNTFIPLLADGEMLTMVEAPGAYLLGANALLIHANQLDLSETVIIDLDARIVTQPTNKTANPEGSFVPIRMVAQMVSELNQILLRPLNLWLNRIGSCSNQSNPQSAATGKVSVEALFPLSSTSVSDQATKVIQVFMRTNLSLMSSRFCCVRAFFRRSEALSMHPEYSNWQMSAYYQDQCATVAGGGARLAAKKFSATMGFAFNKGVCSGFMQISRDPAFDDKTGATYVPVWIEIDYYVFSVYEFADDFPILYLSNGDIESVSPTNMEPEGHVFELVSKDRCLHRFTATDTESRRRWIEAIDTLKRQFVSRKSAVNLGNNAQASTGGGKTPISLTEFANHNPFSSSIDDTILSNSSTGNGGSAGGGATGTGLQNHTNLNNNETIDGNNVSGSDGNGTGAGVNSNTDRETGSQGIAGSGQSESFASVIKAESQQWKDEAKLRYYFMRTQMTSSMLADLDGVDFEAVLRDIGATRLEELSGAFRSFEHTMPQYLPQVGSIMGQLEEIMSQEIAKSRRDAGFSSTRSKYDSLDHEEINNNHLSVISHAGLFDVMNASGGVELNASYAREHGMTSFLREGSNEDNDEDDEPHRRSNIKGDEDEEDREYGENGRSLSCEEVRPVSMMLPKDSKSQKQSDSPSRAAFIAKEQKSGSTRRFLGFLRGSKGSSDVSKHADIALQQAADLEKQRQEEAMRRTRDMEEEQNQLLRRKLALIASCYRRCQGEMSRLIVENRIKAIELLVKVHFDLEDGGQKTGGLKNDALSIQISLAKILSSFNRGSVNFSDPTYFREQLKSMRLSPKPTDQSHHTFIGGANNTGVASTSNTIENNGASLVPLESSSSDPRAAWHDKMWHALVGKVWTPKIDPINEYGIDHTNNGGMDINTAGNMAVSEFSDISSPTSQGGTTPKNTLENDPKSPTIASQPLPPPAMHEPMSPGPITSKLMEDFYAPSSSGKHIRDINNSSTNEKASIFPAESTMDLLLQQKQSSSQYTRDSVATAVDSFPPLPPPPPQTKIVTPKTPTPRPALFEGSDDEDDEDFMLGLIANSPKNGRPERVRMASPHSPLLNEEEGKATLCEDDTTESPKHSANNTAASATAGVGSVEGMVVNSNRESMRRSSLEDVTAIVSNGFIENGGVANAKNTDLLSVICLDQRYLCEDTAHYCYAKTRTEYITKQETQMIEIRASVLKILQKRLLRLKDKVDGENYVHLLPIYQVMSGFLFQSLGMSKEAIEAYADGSLVNSKRMMQCIANEVLEKISEQIVHTDGSKNKSESNNNNSTSRPGSQRSESSTVAHSVGTAALTESSVTGTDSPPASPQRVQRKQPGKMQAVTRRKFLDESSMLVWAYELSPLVGLHVYKLFMEILYKRCVDKYCNDVHGLEKALTLRSFRVLSGSVTHGNGANRSGLLVRANNSSSPSDFQYQENPKGETSDILNERVTCISIDADTNPCDLSIDLLDRLREIIKAFAQSDVGAKVCKQTRTGMALRIKIDHSLIDNVQASSAYKAFEIHCCQLQKIELRGLGINERTLFFCNVYNTITVHSIIARGSPGNSLLERSAFMRNSKYNIGGMLFSLMDIEHGILRHSSTKPMIFGPLTITINFQEKDPRRAFVLEEPRPKISFVLCSASMTSPALRILRNPDDLESDLNKFGQTFLQEHVKLDPRQKLIELPGLLKVYWADFGGNRARVLKMVHSLSLPQFAKEMKPYIVTSDGSKPKVEFSPIDWTPTLLLKKI